MSPIVSDDEAAPIQTKPIVPSKRHAPTPYRQIKEEPVTNLIKEAPIDETWRNDPVQEMDRLIARLRA